MIIMGAVGRPSKLPLRLRHRREWGRPRPRGCRLRRWQRRNIAVVDYCGLAMAEGRRARRNHVVHKSLGRSGGCGLILGIMGKNPAAECVEMGGEGILFPPSSSWGMKGFHSHHKESGAPSLAASNNLLHSDLVCRDECALLSRNFPPFVIVVDSRLRFGPAWRGSNDEDVCCCRDVVVDMVFVALRGVFVLSAPKHCRQRFAFPFSFPPPSLASMATMAF